MPQDENQQAVMGYLAQPLEELLAELDTYAPRPPVMRGERPATPEAGMVFWKTLEPQIWQKLCVEWNWCEKRLESKYQHLESLALILVDYLASLILPAKIPLALVAAIVVKMGLDSFCKCK